MNANGQMEVHYINTGCPYTVTESFMNFFEGLTHMPVNYGHAVPMHDQVYFFFFLKNPPIWIFIYLICPITLFMLLEVFSCVVVMY